MRSLGVIRARVERLASVWPTSPKTTFITWFPPFTRCPSCNCDLEAHARAAALAEAVKGRDPGEPPPCLVFYWTGDLTMCPRCGAALSAVA